MYFIFVNSNKKIYIFIQNVINIFFINPVSCIEGSTYKNPLWRGVLKSQRKKLFFWPYTFSPFFGVTVRIHKIRVAIRTYNKNLDIIFRVSIRTYRPFLLNKGVIF